MDVINAIFKTETNIREGKKESSLRKWLLYLCFPLSGLATYNLIIYLMAPFTFEAKFFERKRTVRKINENFCLFMAIHDRPLHVLALWLLVKTQTVSQVTSLLDQVRFLQSFYSHVWVAYSDMAAEEKMMTGYLNRVSELIIFLS